MKCSPSLKAAFREMMEGLDQDMLVEAMELPKWETSDLVEFRELLDKELSSNYRMSSNE